MATYADVSDVRTAGYGLTIPEDASTAVLALINKAERRLLNRLPSIPARVAAGTLDSALVQGVVEDMVLRVLRNPDCLRSWSIGGGDYSATIDQVVSSGHLYVTDEEFDLLSGASTGARRAQPVRTVVPAWRLP